MGAESGLAGGRPVVLPFGVRGRQRDRWFFTGMAATAALVAFVGFAPSYYLKGIYGGRELSGLVHLHGAVATGWILLFLAQTSLVAAGRTDLHRRLGIAGAVLALLLLGVGYLTAVEAARRGVTPPGGPPPLAFLAIPLGALVSFALLAGVGLYYRRRSDTHKRLMLLATIAVLIPAFARINWIAGGGPRVGIGGTVLLVTACLAYDRLSRGRVHPAFFWGGLFLLLSLPLRIAVSRSEGWLPLAEWLTR